MRKFLTLAAALALVAAAPAVHAITFGIASPTGQAVFHVGAATRSIDPDPGVAVYAGGFGASPPITTVHDPLEVRALYISNGTHAVAFASADVQGWFASYQEGPAFGITDIRTQAAAAIGHGMQASDIIVQATHTHAGPTVEGIWGPVPESYLRKLHDATVAALAAAAAAATPSHLQWGSVDAPYLDNITLNQTDSYPGWKQDGQLSVLRAVAVGTGAPVATFANVPVHGDIIPGSDLQLLSADYFGFARRALEAQLGGVAIVSPATLGREESPVQVGGIAHSEWFAGAVTNLADKALAHAVWLTDDTVSSAETFVQVPADNPALIALNEAWKLPPDQRQAEFEASGIYPIDRDTNMPYATGTAFGTYLTVARVGRLAFVSQPGEPFPEIRDALVRATHDADEIVTLSKAQDDLGYYFPAALTPLVAAHDNDHIQYNPSVAEGDVFIHGSAGLLALVGFDTDPIAYGKPMDNDYSADLKPAVQAIASPARGDVDENGVFTTTLKAIGEPAYLGGNGLQGSTVTWDFGDGTTGQSSYGRKDENRFPHSFPVGTYNVTVTGIDANGAVVRFPLSVEAYPRLVPAVSVDSTNPDGTIAYRVSVSGGDGAVLAVRWSFPDGTGAYGPTATAAASSGSPTVAVTDGTGTVASATL